MTHTTSWELIYFKGVSILFDCRQQHQEELAEMVHHLTLHWPTQMVNQYGIFVRLTWDSPRTLWLASGKFPVSFSYSIKDHGLSALETNFVVPMNTDGRQIAEDFFAGLHDALREITLMLLEVKRLFKTNPDH